MTTRLRQRWLLAVLVAGQFMANVDIAIVNVATPSIHRDLHASAAHSSSSCPGTSSRSRC
jgi:MFS family permease